MIEDAAIKGPGELRERIKALDPRVPYREAEYFMNLLALTLDIDMILKVNFLVYTILAKKFNCPYRKLENRKLEQLAHGQLYRWGYGRQEICI